MEEVICQGILQKTNVFLLIFFDLIKMTESVKKITCMVFKVGSSRFTFPLPETAQPFPANIKKELSAPCQTVEAALSTFQDLDMVVPGAWLSMFGKWLPVSWLENRN